MIRPDDVTDAMVDAAFGDLLDGTGNANWASRPNREIMRGALLRAINASGRVLVPETLIWDLLEALDQVRASRSRGEEDWNALNAADERMRDLLDDAADPREQALDRMAENAQELGLYDEGKEKGDE